jgi:hypothetical protein
VDADYYDDLFYYYEYEEYDMKVKTKIFMLEVIRLTMMMTEKNMMSVVKKLKLIIIMIEYEYVNYFY